MASIMITIRATAPIVAPTATNVPLEWWWGWSISMEVAEGVLEVEVVDVGVVVEVNVIAKEGVSTVENVNLSRFI